MGQNDNSRLNTNNTRTPEIVNDMGTLSNNAELYKSHMHQIRINYQEKYESLLPVVSACNHCPANRRSEHSELSTLSTSCQTTRWYWMERCYSIPSTGQPAFFSHETTIWQLHKQHFHTHTPKYHIKLVLHPDMFFLSPLTYPTTQSKINVPRSISRSRNIISYHIHHVSHIPKHTTIKYSFPYTIAIKVYTEVSQNMGTPKSSILIGCSIINHDNPL